MRYLLLLLLAGCYQDANIYPLHFKNIEAACNEHGGWTLVKVYGETITGRCHDGLYVPIDVMGKKP